MIARTTSPCYYSPLWLAPAALLLGLSFSRSLQEVSAASAIVDPTTYFDAVTTEEERYPYETFVSATALDYDKHQFLSTTADPNEGMAVFWKIHNQPQPIDVGISRNTNENDVSSRYGEEGWVQFAVAVRATSWVSLGISQAGGMYGSDMAIFDTQVSLTEMQDGYVVDNPVVHIDDCASDWTLMNSPILEDGWMIVEFSRLLDTKDDAQDVRLFHDSETRMSAPTRLIAAWGDQETGLGYHGTKRTFSALRLFSPSPDSSTNSDGSLTVSSIGAEVEDTEEQLEVAADGYFETREINYTIPATETTYQHVCLTRQEILEQVTGGEFVDGDEKPSITLIGAVPIISPETAQYVHHFTVVAFSDPEECGDLATFTGLLNAWAPGENGMVYPDDVGMTILSADAASVQSIRLEIHYNNPQEDVGQIDSSGIRFYFSNTPREHELAVLPLGDPFVLLRDQPIGGNDEAGGSGLVSWEFNCAGSCSTAALFDGEPVTVLSESLHMHKSGTRMVNEVIRNDEVVHEAKVEIYDYQYQGAYRVPIEPYQIQQGDSFRTVCTYRDGTSFGQSSQQEMCIVFITYYPAKKLLGASPWLCAAGIPAPICIEEVSNTTLTTEAELRRQYGVSRLDQCPLVEAVVEEEEDDETSEEEERESEGGLDSEEESSPSPALVTIFGMLSAFTLWFLI